MTRTQYYVASSLDGFIADPEPCWVFTSRDLEPRPGVTFTRDDVVGGGELVGRFTDAGLLDEIVLALVPVTLGAGFPLLPRRVELRLEDSSRAGELLMTRFSVVR